VATIGLVAVLDRRSKPAGHRARFWFDNVTFEVPGLREPITNEEQEKIRSMALRKLRTASRGLRVRFSENSGGVYRVRVVQQYPPHPGPPGGVALAMLEPEGGELDASFYAGGSIILGTVFTHPLFLAHRLAR
jgi:hypothetical protein